MRSTLSSLALAIVATAVNPAQAQEARSSLALEEIIVTATKRESSLQDTAIAVSAFTSDMLDTLDIGSPFDFEALVPSFTYQQTPNRISIRGVGRFSNALGVSPGVAVYQDGVFTAEATALSSQPINIQRTEILRGPQGTLYGRNTTGGAVNIISKKPTEEFFGDFRIKLGNYDMRELAFLVSGPITDNLRYKLHVNDRDRNGLQKNLSGADVRSVDNSYYEGQLEWDITERLNLWLKVSQLDSEYIPGVRPSNDPYNCLNVWESLTLSVQNLQCQAGQENPSIGDPRTVAVNTQGKDKLDHNLNTTFRLAYDFGAVQLSYLFGKLEYEFDSLSDFDRTNNELTVNLDVGQYQKQTTHELQLTSSWDKDWNYLLGLFYFEDENQQPYNINTPYRPTMQTVTNGAGDFWENPLGILYFQNAKLDNESWAAYGEVVFELTDTLEMTVGARYSKDDYNGAEVQLQYYDPYREFGGLGISPAPYAFDASQALVGGNPDRYVDTIDATHTDTFENVTGKISLGYRPWDGHLFWGTIANGYKMGGVRLGSLEALYQESAGLKPDGRFAQEDMIMYEAGWKADLLEGKLRTELVGFYYTYDSMQQLRSFQTPPPANLTLDEVVNVDTEMMGLEASATWAMTDKLRAIATYSYNDTEITGDSFFNDRVYGARDENNEIIPDNVKGNKLVLTPEQKAALSLYYFLPTDVGEFTFGGTYAYIGKRYFDLGNYESESAYSRLDLNIGWTSESGRYQIRALVNNATDEDAYNTAGCSVGSDAVYGTPSFVLRCGGNPMNQRLYEAQFIVRI